jgi:hypothetical protein
MYIACRSYAHAPLSHRELAQTLVIVVEPERVMKMTEPQLTVISQFHGNFTLFSIYERYMIFVFRTRENCN